MSLRVGVIGLGIGRSHITGYQAHAGCTVVAVADPDAGRRERVRGEFGVASGYASAEEMLGRERLDVVSVCTPNRFHRELTLAGLAHGCHVLCEKPLAMSAAEGAEMVAAARAAGRRLMVNFSFRFRNESLALKRLVDDGFLGEVYAARTCWLRRRGFPGFGGWFGQKALAGGGPLIDLGVHRLDLALWLMGSPRPEWVLATTSSALGHERAEREGKRFDVESHATGLVRCAGGVALSIEASWGCHRAEREFMETHVYGTRGGVLQRNQGGGYDFTAHAYGDRNGDAFDLQLAIPAAPAPSAQEHFIAALLAGTPHLATGEEALTVQRILDALYESAATGRPVAITA